MKKNTKVLAAAVAMVLGAATMTACGSSTSTSSSAASTSSASAESSSAASTSSASAESSSDAEASGIESIEFGTNAEFPPFEYISANGVIGEYDGIDMAIAAKIGEELGAEVSINNMEFDSLISSLEGNQIDAVIAGMTVTEERQQSVNFSTPYYTATQVMIVKEDSDIEKASDMEGKLISVVQGYTGETCIQALQEEGLNLEYETFKKGTECIMELVNGKCDVVVIDSATAQKYVEDNEGLKIVEDPDEFGSEEYAIAVSKDNTELLDKINDVIDAMLEDGTISDISADYIENVEGE